MSGDDLRGVILLVALACVAMGMGVVGIVTGRAFLTGRNRNMGRWYFDKSLTRIVRNMGFGQTMYGWSMIGAGTSIVGVLFVTRIQATVVLILVGGAMFFVCGVVGFKRVLFPPERLKPDWIVERERGTSS